MSWADSILRAIPVYDTRAALRSLTPVPSFPMLVSVVENLTFYYWKQGSVTADDGSTVLAPSNSIDANQGRWLKFSVTGSGGTLIGDASGAVGANTVSHVTGTTATKLEGSSSVAMRVNGTDALTADTTGLLLYGVRIYTGTGAPSSTPPTGGALYLRQNGTADTTVYFYVTGTGWVAVGTGGGWTLVGDANGAIGSNTVSHVTGTIDTKVAGTTSVALRVNGADAVTANADGMVLYGTNISNGLSAPTVVTDEGDLYIRTATENGSLYQVQNGSWVNLSSGGVGTLAGDASGASDANTVTHVTGTTDTHIHGSTAVTMRIGTTTKMSVNTAASGIRIHTADPYVTGTTDTSSSGLYGTGGTLHTKTLILNVNGTSATLTFAGGSTSANQSAMLAAINATWTGISATVNSSNRLLLWADTSIIIGAGTSNTNLGIGVSNNYAYGELSVTNGALVWRTPAGSYITLAPT